MTVTEGITLTLAALGAVLGVMNTWNEISKRRLRATVRPMHAFAPGYSVNFSIEIINRSDFAVTFTEVGLIVGRARGNRPRRMPILRPVVQDGGPWPRRLEPRQSLSLYFNTADLAGAGEPIGKAYALTACGGIVKGDSGALRQVRAELANI